MTFSSDDSPRTTADRQRDEDSRLMEILRRTLTEAERAMHNEGIYNNPLAGLLDGLDRRAEERITTQLVLRAAQKALRDNDLGPLRYYSDELDRLLRNCL